MTIGFLVCFRGKLRALRALSRCLAPERPRAPQLQAIYLPASCCRRRLHFLILSLGTAAPPRARARITRVRPAQPQPVAG